MAFTGWKQFRGEASFGTYVHRIASNTWKNCIRGEQTVKRKGVVVPLEDFHSDDLSNEEKEQPLTDLMEQERSQQIRKAIEQFPEQMRHCTILRIYHQLKYREIATTLKVTVETVKTQLHLARERLTLEFSAPES